MALVLAIGLYLGFNNDDISQVLSWVDRSNPGLYQVVEVSDGDTIVVDMNGRQERVRLIGIDTPELHHPEKPVQCFAEAASKFTASLVENNKVRLEADPQSGNRDIYERLLRYVYLPDDTDVNASIIREGYGFAYTVFPFDKSEEYESYENLARFDERGLWSECDLSSFED